MKPTGIIRRIDDLGRVVIPKDVRKQCDIHEGDALEIYIDKIDTIPCVCFTKYSPVVCSGELNKVKERIINGMNSCGEYELSSRFKHTIAEVEKIIKEFEERD